MASFKLDEGFSEASGFMDVRDEGGAIFPEVTKAAVEEWIMAQDEDGRRGSCHDRHTPLLWSLQI